MYLRSELSDAFSCRVRFVWPLNLVVMPNVSIDITRRRLSFVVTSMYCRFSFTRKLIPVTLRPALSFPCRLRHSIYASVGSCAGTCVK